MSYLKLAPLLIFAFSLLGLKAAKLTPLTVKNSWIRETPPEGAVTAAYFDIVNPGTVGDHLIGVAAPGAQMTAIHKTVVKDGLSQMEEVSKVAIEPNGKVSFEPGGYHVMIMGLSRSLKDGETFPLTLEFEKSGKLTVEAKVKKN